jgi:hypothetical protein
LYGREVLKVGSSHARLVDAYQVNIAIIVYVLASSSTVVHSWLFRRNGHATKVKHNVLGTLKPLLCHFVMIVCDGKNGTSKRSCQKSRHAFYRQTEGY